MTGRIITTATLDGKPVGMMEPVAKVPAGKTVKSLERGFKIEVGGREFVFDIKIEFDPPLQGAG